MSLETERSWGAALMMVAWVALSFAYVAPAAAQPPAIPESARAVGAVDGDDPRVETRLVVDRQTVAPGETLRVGVLFEIDPNWHVYWRNSGDSGMATQVRWSGGNLSYGALKWPAPRVFESGDGEIVTFGYGKELLLFSEATVSEEAGASVTVEATVDYLACKVDCIPGSAELSREVSVDAESAGSEASEKKANEKLAALFDRYAARAPESPDDAGIGAEVDYSQTPIRPGDTFRAAIGLNFCADGPDSCKDWEVVEQQPGWAFIPDTTAQVDWSGGTMAEHPNAKEGRVLRIEGRASPNAPEEGERLSGVVHLKGPDGEARSILVDAPMPRAEAGAAVEQHESPLLGAVAPAGTGGGGKGGSTGEAASSEAKSASAPRQRVGLWQALLFALLGGMILNLMPCVFPVLALKIGAFTKLVHEERRSILAHGGSYTAGIVGSMWALAGVVIGLRTVGTQVGWGFQFQNPWFPSVLAGVVVVFAMNLFGVFEVGVASGQLEQKTDEAGGLRRSFFEGVLAVLLATPCSAPILGTAVGFALLGSAVEVVAVFTVLGVGLAAPFVVLTLVPGAGKVLPNPGPWMEHLKHVLGFTLIGAAVWLVWVVGRVNGVDGMARLLMFLSVASFGAWLFGRGQRSSTRVQWATLIVAVTLVGAGGYWTLRFDTSPPKTNQVAAGKVGWTEWSDQAVDAQLEAGRPVFVDFTADWCTTCKMNESRVLAADSVVEAFKRHNVAALKGDWTRGGETIRKKLAEFGKGGVPLYLVYHPDAPEDPTVLPELLTREMVIEAVSTDVDGGGA